MYRQTFEPVCKASLVVIHDAQLRLVISIIEIGGYRLYPSR